MSIRYFSSIIANAVIALSGLTSPALAGPNEVIFYLDKTYRPVVKLERLPIQSDGMKAILAMYALQNGAGCDGRNEEGLECALTATLGLGTQCSEQHIHLVRSWFKGGIPNMSGYATKYYKNTQQPGGLEGICYNSPAGASIQRVWDIIRIRQSGGHIIVDAHGTWLAREESGSFRYQTEYVIGKSSISLIAHKELQLPNKR